MNWTKELAESSDDLIQEKLSLEACIWDYLGDCDDAIKDRLIAIDSELEQRGIKLKSFEIQEKEWNEACLLYDNNY